MNAIAGRRSAIDPDQMKALMNSLNTDVGALWRTLNAMAQGFFALLPNLVIGLIVFTLFWIGAKLVKNMIQRATSSNPHANVGVVVGRLVQWAMLFLGLLISIAVVAPSVKPSDVLSILGVGGVAIGFAFKDILQNFVAGILLLLREPFRIGDQIAFEGFEGTVEDVDTRATRLKTYDGRRAIIPNSEIYTKSLIVNTAFEHRRSQYDLGIGYGDDPRTASAAMLEAMQAVEGVLADPAPDVIAIDLAGSSINLRARWWTASRQKDVLHVKGQVLIALVEAMAKAGVDLPFPTRVVLFHDQTDANDGDRAQQREGWPAGAAPPEASGFAKALKSRAAVAAE